MLKLEASIVAMPFQQWVLIRAYDSQTHFRNDNLNLVPMDRMDRWTY